MTARPIVFLDVETDGLHPGRHAYELAMIRRDEHGEREISVFVDIELGNSDPMALNVGRYWERHPDPHRCNGEPYGELYMGPCEAAALVSQWTHGAVIVGCVPSFDTETLAVLLREQGLVPTWHHRIICAYTLAAGYIACSGGPLVPPWSPDEMSLQIGVDMPSDSERHTALGDARWAMRLYDAVMACKP